MLADDWTRQDRQDRQTFAVVFHGLARDVG